MKSNGTLWWRIMSEWCRMNPNDSRSLLSILKRLLCFCECHNRTSPFGHQTNEDFNQYCWMGTESHTNNTLIPQPQGDDGTYLFKERDHNPFLGSWPAMYHRSWWRLRRSPKAWYDDRRHWGPGSFSHRQWSAPICRMWHSQKSRSPQQVSWRILLLRLTT